MSRLPRVAERLLRAVLPHNVRDPVLGDLEEEFTRHIVPERGVYRAWLWYWRQAALTAMRALASRSQQSVHQMRKPFLGMIGLGQDIRYALRTLRKNPGFTAGAVATLGIGVGASVAIFSVVHAVLLRPLPYRDPGRLVTIVESERPNDPTAKYPVAPANFLDWRERNTVFEQIGASTTLSYALTGSGDPERLVGGLVSATVFPMLGVQPALGRMFRGTDDAASAERVVLLSDGLWRRRFGASPAIVGRAITLNGDPYVVIGVMAQGLVYPDPEAELWIPLERGISREDMLWRGSHYLTVVARLREPVGIDQARAQLNQIALVLKNAHPDHNIGGVVIRRMQEDLVADVRPALRLLTGAVMLVLLIACANVANLLLVRAAGRELEITLRAALGAGRLRILRQLTVEGLVLSLFGAACGTIIAVLLRDVIVAFAPASLPQVNAVRVDGAVLGFAAAVAVATGVLFGLLPGVFAVRVDTSEALHGGTRTASLRSAGRLRAALIVSEVALSVMLLVTAALLIRSFANLKGLQPGFNPDATLTARINLPRAQYRDTTTRAPFYERVLSRLRETPGITAVSAVSDLPLTGNNFDNSFDVEGRPPRAAGSFVYALMRFADHEYFRMVGIPLRRGRLFTHRDRADSPPVAIITESMARKHFPGEDPLGKRLIIHMGENPPPREIVGIVGDVLTDVTGPAEPIMYVPYRQLATASMVVLVRGEADAATLTRHVRAAVASADPLQPIYRIRPLDDVIREALVPWRFSMVLVGSFAAIALALAAVGVFGVTSYLVAQRTREIGVRMALGADRADVIAMVVGAGARVTLAGCALGLLVSTFATRLVESQVFGVSGRDPVIMGSVVVLLALVTMLACYMPARRATRIDPAEALRAE